MFDIINLKKKKRRKSSFKAVLVIIGALILTTAGIKATDVLVTNNTANKNVNACPENMVFVSSIQGGFCLDKYEASPKNNCPNQIPANQEQTRQNIDNLDCQAQSVSGAIPWTNVSQTQAGEVCAKLGKRLPSSSEWLAAALATPDKTSDWNVDDCQVARNWPEQPGKTGTGKNCLSGSEAYDMIGNVWEWVGETIEDGQFKGKTLPEEGYVTGIDQTNSYPSATNADQADQNFHNDFFWIKTQGLRSVARGGYWDNKAEAGQYSVYAVYESNFSGVGVGFRCVK